MISAFAPRSVHRPQSEQVSIFEDGVSIPRIGALIIKERYGFSDEDTVEEIRMNPYLQFFLGLPVFQHEAPFDASTMTLFRKRIPVIEHNKTKNAMSQANAMLWRAGLE
jgi:hypothetical protein